MGIPTAQLQAWSNQGALVAAMKTHKSIRAALDSYQYWPEGIDFDVYLQGSYRNHTNVRGVSDVDVVVELNSVYSRDTSSLPSNQIIEEAASLVAASYTWAAFRSDVLSALRDHYGWFSVSEGKKSLKLPGASGRLAADVVPCIAHDRIVSFQSAGNYKYFGGITF